MNFELYIYHVSMVINNNIISIIGKSRPTTIIHYLYVEILSSESIVKCLHFK